MRVKKAELGLSDVTIYDGQISSHARVGKWQDFNFVRINGEPPEQDGGEILIVFAAEALVVRKHLFDDGESRTNDFL